MYIIYIYIYPNLFYSSIYINILYSILKNYTEYTRKLMLPQAPRQAVEYTPLGLDSSVVSPEYIVEH